jgi:gluconate kinase
MRAGIALNDKNRLPWLKILRGILCKWNSTGANGVLACSALKQKYRHLLNSNFYPDDDDHAESSVGLCSHDEDSDHDDHDHDHDHDHETTMSRDSGGGGGGGDKLFNLNILYVLLNCEKFIIERRLLNRHNHDIVSGTSILNSQFKTLELPKRGDCIWSSDEDKNDDHYHDTTAADELDEGDGEYCYLNLEKSFLNSECFYFIYVVNSSRERTVLDNVYEIVRFLPKFSNFLK